MRLRLISEFALAVCFFIAGARTAAGQTTVALNYDPLLHELSETSALGAHGDVARQFGSIAVVGEVGANHFNQATVITLAPGIRYKFGTSASSKIQPSVQALFGLWHCSACEVNASFFQPGVVLDYARGGSMAFRFQFDVRRIFFDFGGETAERIGVGVVWTIR